MQILILMMILGFGLFLHTSMAEEETLAQITLVTDGKPNSTIVVAKNSTPSANLAALEFQYHIRKITGAVLPIKTDSEEVIGIRILIGEVCNEDFPDGVTILLGEKVTGFICLEHFMNCDSSTPFGIVAFTAERIDNIFNGRVPDVI